MDVKEKITKLYDTLESQSTVNNNLITKLTQLRHKIKNCDNILLINKYNKQIDDIDKEITNNINTLVFEKKITFEDTINNLHAFDLKTIKNYVDTYN